MSYEIFVQVGAVQVWWLERLLDYNLIRYAGVPRVCERTKDSCRDSSFGAEVLCRPWKKKNKAILFSELRSLQVVRLRMPVVVLSWYPANYAPTCWLLSTSVQLLCCPNNGAYTGRFSPSRNART
jgi:hypothetical protein